MEKNYSLSSHYFLSLLRASSLFLYQIYFYFKTTGCSVGMYQPVFYPNESLFLLSLLLKLVILLVFSGLSLFPGFLTTRLDLIHFATGVVENGCAPSLANISANFKKSSK
jgi:hypothetical protein